MGNGFKAAKRAVIAALETGSYLHAARGDIAIKNLLAVGAVSARTVIEVIRSCSGAHHSCSAHHMAPEVIVHVLRRHGWYIKFYFIEPDTWFLSVHQ
ncbi:hypothetical protein [Pseudomonas shirazensis]|uniref:hypothetical protein n=1 Tax=Pseudomonas shirazensis TaxID=2745494 RepID=UPI003D2CC65F